ncbi:NAD(P)/FAD-dependent oxidoreductase [Oceanispirochaeta sp.]|jgi:glycerol-3-phosphate dehydrogenase|uniref:NAD(P)/FAD-dependent oxidoreductase n=1 Tax=Oceanispirochaeta sp. TaxID=2035350 RepID=UPI0026113BBE|nr:NAD(P)/FAD-dependent oxidoreductase [Oceanispirochaeta sp.]MDA3957940.1 NAD(P)/FAD-dependent oxidoreductase [Oceanispirochaeta sp.]
MESADVLIIGAGVVGCALARQLSRYKLNILLLEASDDVGTGATRANSGIVHGGYTAKAGTLKGDLCIKGNRMYDQLEEELNFGFRRTGSLVLAFAPEDLITLNNLMQNGERNGVKGLKILSADETLSLSPALNPALLGALHCPETGIVSPYEFCIALAENAIRNGVTLHLDSPVDAISKLGSGFQVKSGNRAFSSKYVINAAGAGSAEIAALAGAANFSIHPRKGQYLLLRRGSARLLDLDLVVFQPPTEKGKGILVTPTVWGNLLIGPNAEEVQSPEDLGTDPETLAAIMRTARLSVPSLDPKLTIRMFSGVRPGGDRGDFIIEESPVEDFFNLAGIESPGLTSSPAIALMVEGLLKEKGLLLQEKEDFDPHRKALCRPGTLQSPKEASAGADRPYGDPERFVCRCEQVSESVLRDSLSRGIPIRSLDAVKRRTRAGMGACQGRFCGPRVREYLIKERGLEEADISGPSRDPGGIRNTLDQLLRLLEINP